jgi:hypothetical protein
LGRRGDFLGFVKNLWDVLLRCLGLFKTPKDYNEKLQGLPKTPKNELKAFLAEGKKWLICFFGVNM